MLQFIITGKTAGVSSASIKVVRFGHKGSREEFFSLCEVFLRMRQPSPAITVEIVGVESARIAIGRQPTARLCAAIVPSQHRSSVRIAAGSRTASSSGRGSRPRTLTTP